MWLLYSKICLWHWLQFHAHNWWEGGGVGLIPHLLRTVRLIIWQWWNLWILNSGLVILTPFCSYFTWTEFEKIVYLQGYTLTYFIGKVYYFCKGVFLYLNVYFCKGIIPVNVYFCKGMFVQRYTLTYFFAFYCSKALLPLLQIADMHLIECWAWRGLTKELFCRQWRYTKLEC